MLIEMDIRVVSEANLREHWRPRARRSQGQRSAAMVYCLERFGRNWKPTPPLTITLTRIAPRRLDSDNLARAFKSVRDGIADALGIDDGDERLTWVYNQHRGRPGQYAVAVTIDATD